MNTTLKKNAKKYLLAITLLAILTACGGLTSKNAGKEEVQSVGISDKAPTKDNIKPVITLKGSSSLTITVGDSYKEEGATATDNVDGDITSKIVKSGNVDTTTAGTYTIRYSVKDSAGNSAKEVVREVVVKNLAKSKIFKIGKLSLKDFEEKYHVGMHNGTMNIPKGGKRTLISSKEELLNILSEGNIEPNDKIVLEDGIYEDWGLIIWPKALSGENGKRIYLIPQSQGGVTFKGSVSFYIGGANIAIEGFRFVDIKPLDSQYGRLFRTANNNIKLSYNEFNHIYRDKLSDGKAQISTVIYIDGDNVEIDYNDFTKIKGISIIVRQTGTNYKDIKNIKDPYFHHNRFYEIDSDVDNGGEVMMIGYGTNYDEIYNDYDNYINAIIEYNSFYKTVGDTEIISLKSSGNIVQNNYLSDNQTSHICVRYGDDNLISSNYITNSWRAFRNSGKRNRFVYNYVNLVNSENSNFMILHDRRVDDQNITAYLASIDNIIESNLVIKAKNIIEILDMNWAGKIEEEVKNNQFLNNLFTVPYDNYNILVDDSLIYNQFEDFNKSNTFKGNIYKKYDNQPVITSDTIERFFNLKDIDRPFWMDEVFTK